MSSRYSPGELNIASAMLHAAMEENAHPTHAPSHRFVTVSRQAGAAGRTFARELVEKLNSLPHDRLWACWDQELVEKVSKDYDIEKALVAQLEQNPHNWVVEVLEGFTTPDKRHPDEMIVYRRVAMVVRALAEAGNAVIVGRGGAFLTADIPGGLHVRLVAPRIRRIAHVAEREGISEREAATKLTQMERARDAFYKRHWPDRALGPEEFTVTFNSDKLSIPQIVQAVLPMLQGAPVHV